MHLSSFSCVSLTEAIAEGGKETKPQKRMKYQKWYSWCLEIKQRGAQHELCNSNWMTWTFAFGQNLKSFPVLKKNEAQNALRQRKWCLKQSRWTAELEYATSPYQIWNINIKYKLWISNTKQAIDPIDCRVKILPTHHACQCGKNKE